MTSMPKIIQLRNVPDDLHQKLKARAAEAGVSLSAYILAEARKQAEQPSYEEFRRNLAKMKPIETRESSEAAVRAIRDSR